jgi:hypothetical protein
MMKCAVLLPVFSLPNQSKAFRRGTVFFLLPLLNPRRYGDGAKDLFITLNCIQENIIRGGQRDRSRRRPDGSRMPKSRAIKGIDEDMKLNNLSAWQMTEII